MLQTRCFSGLPPKNSSLYLFLGTTCTTVAFALIDHKPFFFPPKVYLLDVDGLSWLHLFSFTINSQQWLLPQTNLCASIALLKASFCLFPSFSKKINIFLGSVSAPFLDHFCLYHSKTNKNEGGIFISAPDFLFLCSYNTSTYRSLTVYDLCFVSESSVETWSTRW